ncbi:MAG: lamin tail domain-containing protein [Balneolaceae bacterium]|nr:lamin tail domain-containing protein [Balneolaceae bacterium]
MSVAAIQKQFLLFVTILMLTAPPLFAQQVVFQESFEEYEDDTDFIENSSWSGDLEDFTIVEDDNNQLLRLNAESAGLSQLITESSTAYGTWEFYYRPDVDPSNNNRTHFFLAVDSNDFNIIGGGATSQANGYVLRAGDNTGNRVFKLGKVVNGNFETDNIFLETETVIEGGVGYFVRITRSEDSDWQIFLTDDTESGNEESTEIVRDSFEFTPVYSGFAVTYSGLNTDNFFYDNIIISEETEELTVENVELIRADQVNVTFNNPIDATALETDNFFVNQGVGNPQSALPDGENAVLLTFSEPFEDGNYTLTINNVQDTAGEAIEPETEVQFTAENPFEVESVNIINSARIDVEFTSVPDEADLQSENFVINEQGETAFITPESIGYDETEDPNTIFLNFEPALPIGDYQLTISDLNSDNGWPLRDENLFDFTVSNPFVITDFTPVNRTTFDIIFSQDILSGGEEEDNYLLENVGLPESAVVTEENEVRLQFAARLEEGAHKLIINNLQSVENWQIETDTEQEFTFENQFDVISAELGASDEVEVIFTEAPEESDLSDTNFEVAGIGNPQNVVYDASGQPGLVILEFASAFPEGNYTLTISDVNTPFGWPLSDETEFNFEVENPFFVTEFEAESRTEFLITFSRDVAMFDMSDFEITGFGSPDDAEPEESDAIRLIYSEPVDIGEQELIVKNLQSTEGWLIEEDTTIPFFLFDTYAEGDLVMSEFYYRTPVSWRTDEVDRPRYVEIYNRSDKLLNLHGFTMTGVVFSEDDMPISPGEYLVLTVGSEIFEEQFGNRNFVEVDDFPTMSLTTSGTLLFETNQGEKIEELTYQASTWGGNEVALERFSFETPARFRDNWAESEDVLTGSPGLPNTVTTPGDSPEAVAAEFPAPGTFHITFSRTLSEAAVDELTNFSLDNDGVITSAEFTTDERTLEFTTEDNLEDLSGYTFTYQNVEDIFGNEVAGALEFGFTFENPFRILSAELEDENRLIVRFTLPMQTSTITASDFELGDGTQPVSAEILNSETARLVFDEGFEVGSYQIIVNDIASTEPNVNNPWELEVNSSADFYRFDEYQPGDIVLNEFMYRPPDGYPRYVEVHNSSGRFLNLRDWELRRAEGASNNGGVISEFDLPIEPGSFLVITSDESALEEIFNEGPWLQMSNYPGLTQTVPDRIRLIDNDGGLVEFIDYDPSTWGGNGVSLERRSTGISANDINNWGESEAELLGTPGEPNSIGPLEEGPQLTDATIISADTLSVTFSGALDQDAITTGNFSLSGGLSVDEIEFVNSVNLRLQLSNSMSSGTNYTLTVSDIPDIFGNVLAEANTSFTYYEIEEAEPGDVVINEFMYNEPDGYTRYIELYNASNRTFDLAGWQQANDTGTRRTLTNTPTVFPPDSYMVILPNENLLDIFPGISHVNAGGTFSALKNGGDNIVITNADGVVIDSLRYSPDWGGEGVALERRRVDRPSTSAENWAESPNELLGTPGAPNEVSADFVLTVTKVRALSQTLVQVVFNTAIRSGDTATGNFSVNGTSPNSVSLEGENELILEFESAMPTGERTLTISNVRTKGGFHIGDGSEFSFMVFDEFEDGDIVINEFMYRPPQGYARYVELFNNSGKLLNLRNWRLQRRQVSTESPRIISSDDLLFHPGDYIVLTDNEEIMADIYGERNYLKMSNFPSYTVTVADQIRLFTAEDVLADSLEYNPSEWGGDGVALERLSTDVPATLRQNWEESPNDMLGTPGFPNDATPDTDPPVLLSGVQFEDQGFHLVFDRQLDIDTVTDLSNYTISPAVPISIAEADGNEVILFTGNDLVNDQVYEITVNGITGIFGNEIEETTVSVHYLDFAEAQPQQIVINEILYRRLQADSPEFVEIFNRSDQNFDLGGWSLSDAGGSAVIPTGTTIRENDYLVLTDTESFAAESGQIIYLPGFRSLSNTSDAVVLHDGNDVAIDSVYYRASWYNNPAGVSLERKDPSAISIDPANWGMSTDDRGSTPAEKNSRLEMDETPPEILFANMIHPDSVEVVFSKFVEIGGTGNAEFELADITGPDMQFGSQQRSARFSLNGVEADLIWYDPMQGDRIVLDGSGVSPGEEITLVAENLGDFQGNISAQTNHPVAQPVSEGDLVFNEIMFNPIADNRDGLPEQSEYIEIYNRRPYAISMVGLFMHDEPDDHGEITRIEPVSSDTRWIPANGYALFYPESQHEPFTESRTARFFDISEEFECFALRANRSTLSLSNSGRKVYLADSTLTTIDMVEYNPDWHNPNIVDTRGIALERINPDFDTNDPSNWGSNATVLGGTPGGENSIYQDSGVTISNSGVELTPNPFSPDGSGHEDHLFINYIFEEPDYLLRIRIYDRYGRLVRNLTEGEAAGFEGSVIWDGRTDDGRENRIGIYIVFVEAYNSTNGENRSFRETAVIARQF